MITFAEVKLSINQTANNNKNNYKMGFNEFLSSIFGNKSTRVMKEIQPWVDKVKAAYPEIDSLDNDALRAKTEELKAYIRNSAAQQRAKVDELKATVELIP